MVESKYGMYEKRGMFSYKFLFDNFENFLRVRGSSR